MVPMMRLQKMEPEDALEEEDDEFKDTPELSLAHAKDEGDIAIHLRPPSSSSANTHLIVIAPSAWLSRVPYFDSSLREPSISPSRADTVRRVILDCAPDTSTHAYFRCLRLLTATAPLSPRLFDSVSEVLELLPVANHLLFDECIDACLEFLGCTPWSVEDEDAIRATLNHLGIEPHGAVQERLDTSHDVASLQTVFVHMLDVRGLEGTFFDMVQKCLQSPSESVKAVSHSILLKLRSVQSANVSREGALPRQWFILTKALLQLTDAQDIVLEFVNSQALSDSLNNKANHKDSVCILTLVFEKVLKGVVSLSISQRTELVKLYAPLGQFIKDSSFNEALRGVVDTLPLNHPALLQLMKSRPKMGLFPMWFDRLLHRIDGLKSHEVQVLCEKLNGKTDIR